jgi:hypothetical protein
VSYLHPLHTEDTSRIQTAQPGHSTAIAALSCISMRRCSSDRRGGSGVRRAVERTADPRGIGMAQDGLSRPQEAGTSATSFDSRPSASSAEPVAGDVNALDTSINSAEIPTPQPAALEPQNPQAHQNRTRATRFHTAPRSHPPEQPQPQTHHSCTEAQEPCGHPNQA